MGEPRILLAVHMGHQSIVRTATERAPVWQACPCRVALTIEGNYILEPELWISSVFFWNAPNGVWHDDFAHFDLWLRQNTGSQT